MQVHRANSGRDPFPLYLKRGKVYKKLDSPEVRTQPAPNSRCITKDVVAVIGYSLSAGSEHVVVFGGHKWD